jgi:hypothetical protein
LTIPNDERYKENMADKFTIFAPDFKMLAHQKQTLTDLISNGSLSKEQKDHLEGLRNFIDHIQDYAAGELGAQKVYYVRDVKAIFDWDGKFVSEITD